MEIEKHIEVESCTIEELFACTDKNIGSSTIKGQLSIPEYQRPYVWGSKQLKKLIRDVQEYRADKREDKPLYYLGSIILHKDKNGNKLNIIDGQQRVTSLLIWYCIQNEDYNLPIQYTSPSSIAQIKKNINFLNQEENLPTISLSQFEITLVVTDSEDDAYTFFETQNTGGIRLTGVDIMKSHHLRAISDSDELNRYARDWENLVDLEYVINLTTKARYWNFLNWRQFPLYRKTKEIKEVIIDEFTEITQKQDNNISYCQVVIDNKDQSQIMASKSRNIRQPLSDGVNTIGYFREMVAHYHTTIENGSYHYFRSELINGADGTCFLKELFDVCTLAYVNKFGCDNLMEFSLWAFRYCYSKRVTNSRTVRENSVFKFISEEKVIDKIVNVCTHDEVIEYLKKFQYSFNAENTESCTTVKARYIKNLRSYFSPSFDNMELSELTFDKCLINGINAKLK